MFNIFKSREKKCSSCNSVLAGRYWKIASYYYCQTCYTEKDICSICGRAGKHFTSLGRSRTICPECSKTIPRCGVCGTMITGKYHFAKEQNLPVCAKCMEKTAICFSCGGIITGKAVSYPDGSLQCGSCGKEAVTSVKTAGEMLREIDRFFASSLSLTIGEKLHLFNLVDKKALKRLAGKRADLFGAFMRKDGKNSIFCLTGLPTEQMYAVLAHERAHMWQAFNCKKQQTEGLREGFAEWAAYKFCLSKGFLPQTKKMITGKNIYVRSLLRLISWEKKYSYSAFLERVKHNKGLLG